MTSTDGRRGWLVWRVVLPVGISALLLCLAAVNVLLRAGWREVEDGVLWGARDGGVVAQEIAPHSPAARAGLSAGDVLLAIDGRPVESVSDVLAALHAGRNGQALTYTTLRLRGQELRQITLAPIPDGDRVLYFMLAGVGVFTLLVGASVRLRRPTDPSTLHFFWLSVAFFGLLTFSFSGRLDALDRFFYWADVVARLLLPPLFVHFALVFPERPQAWVKSDSGRAMLPALYLPAFLIGGAQVAAFAGRAVTGTFFTSILSSVDRLELTYLAACLVGGLAVLVRALRRVRSVTARRQLRWIVWGTAIGALPFVVLYVVPFVLGATPSRPLQFTALLLGLVPLAFASAIVRYRLWDVEVIIKRGVVYATAIAAIAIIYAVLLRVAEAIFLDGRDEHNTVIAMLATLSVVLLARPVKDAIQTALDRAYYRDRYDYRRALVAFARDLNSDLDLHRLSERLVARVVETLLVDRMALLLAPPSGAGDFLPIGAVGFTDIPPRIGRESELAARLRGGHLVSLDDAHAGRRLPPDEAAVWKDAGAHAFVPCVSKEGTIAIMVLGRRGDGEPLSSEDTALLTAVASQAATALENARLYRQLRLKADEVERMREFSENVLESLNDGLVVIDLDERVVRWNRKLEELSGVARPDAVGSRIDALVDGAFLDAIRGARRESPSGATLFRVPLGLGTTEARKRLLVNVAAAPLRTPEGATAGSIIVIEDITSRVALEEQLQISEKMASIGLLAAGVAHEVNTPLTGISSFTQMLLEHADPDDPKTKVLEKIERQTFRAAKIVNGLLNLARPARVETGPVDLNVVVNDVLALLEHQFKSGRIQVRKDLATATTPIVDGIEYKLQQVLLNLFLNARDSMPKGGWLSIGTRLENGSALVEVSDTGSGIPAEHLSRIYDPFFTTKVLGKGTGLGLSITYGIVQEHGGSIACESAAGQGTRFTLTLPLASAAARHGDAG